jgi:hypothetical protein
MWRPKNNIRKKSKIKGRFGVFFATIKDRGLFETTQGETRESNSFFPVSQVRAPWFPSRPQEYTIILEEK